MLLDTINLSCGVKKKKERKDKERKKSGLIPLRAAVPHLNYYIYMGHYVPTHGLMGSICIIHNFSLGVLPAARMSNEGEKRKREK